LSTAVKSCTHMFCKGATSMPIISSEVY